MGNHTTEEQDAKKTAAFASTPLFQGLAGDHQKALAKCSSQREFSPGEYLFREGNPCDGLWVLGEGRVKITKASPSGREIMLALDSAPSSLAEVPLFDGGDYPASVVAVETAQAYLLPTGEFHRYCHAHPEVALKILEVVGGRLRQLVQLVEVVTFGSMRQRLAKVLLDLRGERSSDSFKLPFTQADLASRLGTIEEVVTRNLARFQAEGSIRLTDHSVEIIDVEALRAEAEAEF